MFGFEISCAFNASTALFLTTILILWHWWKRPHSRFPPGPRGVPILGILPFCGSHPVRDFKKWSLEKYGSIMSVRMANKEVVTLNTFDAITQVFRKQGEASSDRPWVHCYAQVLGRNGVAFKNYGNAHQTLKNFLVRSLKDFGMGKREMEDRIYDEWEHFEDQLKTMVGQPIDLTDYSIEVMINIVIKLAIGKRFKYGDQNLKLYLDALKLQSSARNPTAMAFAFFFPALRWFVPPVRDATNNYYLSESTIVGSFESTIKEHKERFDAEAIYDVTDDYLKAKERAERNGDDTFSKERELQTILRDLVVAGSEPSSYTVLWTILGVLNYPEYYKIIMEEIDHISEEYGRISMKNRKSMPFTCAFIQEIFRHCAVVPNGVPHCAGSDMKVDGFYIPKGTELIANIWGAHMDPNDWEDPLEFNPNRHIDGDGNFVYSQKVNPFSVGPRYCLGEGLGRMEVFLIFCNILKTFNIKPATSPLPALDDGLDFALYTPKHFKVILAKR